jgi:preprotein translocase subunit SecA
MVLIKVISFLFKEICHKALRYRRSGRSTRKEDYKLSKDEVPNSESANHEAGETQATSY